MSKLALQQQAAAIGTAASKALMWLGWIGIAVTVFTTLYNMFKTEVPKTAAEASFRETTGKTKSSYRGVCITFCNTKSHF